jgi:hypothetical protein
MNKTDRNSAYIDSQNLNLGIQRLGWKLDYHKFRIYLREIYGVQDAYIGYIPDNQDLYTFLKGKLAYKKKNTA